MNNTYILIPVYNEAGIIAQVLRDIQKEGFHNIIVVDDGSTDSTIAAAASTGVTVLRHMINRGKGAAIGTAIQAASILEADTIVTIDGDGQHNPRDIRRLINATRQYDVVLGVRTINGTSMPVSRKFANMLGNMATWLFYGVWVNDSQCGFRAYTRKAYAKMKIVNDRYEYDSEVIRELSRHRLTHTEVPVEAKYTHYSLNKQHKQSFGNGIRMIIRLLVSS